MIVQVDMCLAKHVKNFVNILGTSYGSSIYRSLITLFIPYMTFPFLVLHSYVLETFNIYPFF